MEDKYAARLAALLNKAENASNAAESAAYQEKAQQLATKYQIDLERLRMSAPANLRETPATHSVTLGKARKVGLGSYVTLIYGIALSNNVKLTVTLDSTVVNLYGFQSDIDTVVVLYSSLILQLINASEAYMRAESYKKELVWREKWTGNYSEWGYFPTSGRSARISFQEAFAATVRHRLAEAVRSAKQDVSSGTGAELVLVSRKSEVEDFFQARTGGGRGKYYGSSYTASKGSWEAGHQAGQRASLGNSQVSNSRQSISR